MDFHVRFDAFVYLAFCAGVVLGVVVAGVALYRVGYENGREDATGAGRPNYKELKGP